MGDFVHIERVCGPALQDMIPALSHLRLKVFHEFPYLYDGTMAEEEKYLRAFVASPDAAIIIARDGKQIVGASTAVPLKDETPTVQKPFIENGIDPETVFYFGESVLEKEYRGRGIGLRFFEEREAHARSFPWMRMTAFCAVKRDPSHPLWPADYKPLDEFWQKRGYLRQGHLRTWFSWKELGEETESEKEMVFWTRSWSAP